MVTSNEIREKDYKKIIDMYLEGKSGLFIAKEYNVTPGKIYYLLNKLNVKRRSNKINSRKYHYDKRYFKEINNQEKAYWLGFIYADGYIRKNKEGHKNGDNKSFGLALSVKDKNHLKKFKNSINATYPINEYEQQENEFGGGKYCRIQIFGEEIFDSLKKHGVLEHKTFKLSPPKVKEKFVSHFIRGYFDGDGSIYDYDNYCNTDTREYRVKIVGTIPILNYIKEFIELNEIANINRYYKRRKTDIVMTLELGGNKQVKNFLDLIYHNANLYLDRKYKKYKELCSQCCRIN